MSNQIAKHRQKIDDLDAQILDLVQQRIDESVAIRKLKIENNIPLFTPERERELIDTLIQRSGGKISPEVIEEIWLTIIQGGKKIGEDQ